jgi:hypothetical protein
MRHRTMLYHLISLNPGKDITLHVSTNNPAMVRSLRILHVVYEAHDFVSATVTL